MISNLLSHHANEAAARYGRLIDSWQSHFNTSLNDDDFGTSTHVARFIERVVGEAHLFMEDEALIAKSVFTEIAKEAHHATLRDLSITPPDELPERVSDLMSASFDYYLAQLSAQLMRDVATIRNAAQRVALETFASSRSRGISQRSAMIEYRIGSHAVLEFFFHDRAGRKWSSRKLVRSIYRHTLLSTYNESVMLTLVDNNLRRARVVHEDVNAQFHNMIISFGANSEAPIYSEIRDTVFHPNSNAILAMESSDVSA